MGEIARTLKDGRHAVIVVCPSHIRKVEVPTQEALVELGRARSLLLNLMAGQKKSFEREKAVELDNEEAVYQMTES